MIRVLQGQTLSDSERCSKSQSLLIGTILRWAAPTVVLLSLPIIQPATAQSNVVCSADNLPSIIGGLFRLTTALGIVGLTIVWQADLLIEMSILDSEQKKGLKRYKRSAMKSAAALVAPGPLYTVAGAVMELLLAESINLVLW